MSTAIQVGEAFARREEAEGSSLAVSVQGSGEARRAVLRSFDTPVAVCDKARAAYFSSQRHSVTTSKSVMQVKSACERLGVRVEVLDPAAFAARVGRREGRMS